MGRSAGQRIVELFICTSDSMHLRNALTHADPTSLSVLHYAAHTNYLPQASRLDDDICAVVQPKSSWGRFQPETKNCYIPIGGKQLDSGHSESDEHLLGIMSIIIKVDLSIASSFLCL
jgi:hypothetical protein